MGIADTDKEASSGQLKNLPGLSHISVRSGRAILQERPFRSTGDGTKGIM